MGTLKQRTSAQNICKINKNPLIWKKSFAVYITDKELSLEYIYNITKIYKKKDKQSNEMGLKEQRGRGSTRIFISLGETKSQKIDKMFNLSKDQENGN